MTIVDLAKARAYADALTGSMDPAQHAEAAADWIRELADEVESLDRALHARNVEAKTATIQAVGLQDERDQALAGLRELYERIGAMLREARHIIDHHPDPAASAAAMRIAREDKS